MKATAYVCVFGLGQSVLHLWDSFFILEFCKKSFLGANWDRGYCWRKNYQAFSVLYSSCDLFFTKQLFLCLQEAIKCYDICISGFTRIIVL